MGAERAGLLERLLLAVLYGLTLLAAGLLGLLLAGLTPPTIPGVGADRLGATMALLVAGIGAASYRFALRALDGEPHLRSFLRWLFGTILAALALMLTQNLLALLTSWTLVSLGLHQLLTFYRSRPQALRPARKKFLISRLGDLALLAAIGMIGLRWGTLDLGEALAAAERAPAWEIQAVALLLVIAALTKSAQMPFHSWLPDTMEAPTPVSALMHAGIINAGGVLLLRFSPIIAQAEAALLLLIVVGTLTAVVGALAMWAQASVKRSLAWSTVSQMGFMMVQCGLGAFPAAALHIIGHGCYKAWAFLRAGDLPPAAAAPAPITPPRALLISLLGAAAATPALALAAALTGFDPLHSPGELALSAILALAIGQIWLALHRQRYSTPMRLALGTAHTLAIALGAFALYQAAALLLGPSLSAAPYGGALYAAACALPAIACATLIALYALRPWLPLALTVHARQGFYIGHYADRLTDRIWLSLSSADKEAQRV